MPSVDLDKQTAAEETKHGSHYLRGRIAEELADANPAFGKESIQLLKHHGTYQQDNRDERAAARKAGKPGGKAFMMMIRTTIPGGRLSTAQLVSELNLADELGNGTLRITTRQGLQLHGVLKHDLRETIRRINACGLTTKAACGDVVRNVMCTPAPFRLDSVHSELQDTARALALELSPRTGAYRELFLTDPETGERELVGKTPDPQEEPLYGPTYLPRKFKIALGLPGDNSVDLYANDLAFMAVCEDFRIVGYNVLVGGGFGHTPSANKTFVALAKPLGFVPRGAEIEIAKAVIGVQRDHGNRTDRKVARLKYLVAEWGLEKFRERVEAYFGQSLEPPRAVTAEGFDDGLGWREQGDGKWFYGLNVENGRIKDDGDFRLKTALRAIAGEWDLPLVLTPHQSLIFADVAPADRDALERVLRNHGVPLTEDISPVRRWSMACPALPTCGLAITESERFLPGLIDILESELEGLGLGEEVFTIRMTGCPNGCARPYNADIGLVGKAKGKYTILLGGRLRGDRLNFIYQDQVAEADLVPTLVAVFAYFKTARNPGETLGDFCHRQGREALLAATDPTRPG